ncbi:hypothetical protein A3B85_02865 [Candidatus Nomurabacteria bacterium RIFCSPHIGHO2_02_FULL_37_13]|uniref:Histidine biosynthesis bifunctional protein HisIE n=1 Tax=Candidatus Nomurabacteria bacterium RIFCSPHIGHO2_02_FULL_37_13 TaxID=1801750 RepID=A0A1F6W6W5_9BACT|nr:MAG: hypothetical protein A2640_01345 [Candidatus Nomurabacteria bacterium RIFCSPHIGHO2_01_FULL_36_23]OGI77670.1 MAG: hypothetical protein A3B85_02865 [Candidatus Nomurabacteria bacterium RIFCSPHIGHO2_02_FULL_37_13]OGI88240.1 MAG: hypothetical protein A2906_01650 [Candidatus Nomurabacteria bacterium RIFCSPLOWO2_01_FULL_37_25]
MIVKVNCIQPDFTKQGGLIPVIIQKHNQEQRGEVLMLAYSNSEAYNLTKKTGLVHFWSRSRKKLWKKGETSGNLLVVRQIWMDCDQDTLLYVVTPRGTVCHLEKSSCFSQVTYVAGEEIGTVYTT